MSYGTVVYSAFKWSMTLDLNNMLNIISYRGAAAGISRIAFNSGYIFMRLSVPKLENFIGFNVELSV